MPKSLYTVVLIKHSELRDIKLSSILDDGEMIDYLPEGSNYDYIFGLNNAISDKLSKYSRIYKTLNGAKRFCERYKTDVSYKLRYVRKISKSEYTPVVLEITKAWDSMIDGLIENRTQKYNEDVSRLQSKKSGNQES